MHVISVVDLSKDLVHNEDYVKLGKVRYDHYKQGLYVCLLQQFKKNRQERTSRTRARMVYLIIIYVYIKVSFGYGTQK